MVCVSCGRLPRLHEPEDQAQVSDSRFGRGITYCTSWSNCASGGLGELSSRGELKLVTATEIAFSLRIDLWLLRLATLGLESSPGCGPMLRLKKSTYLPRQRKTRLPQRQHKWESSSPTCLSNSTVGLTAPNRAPCCRLRMTMTKWHSPRCQWRKCLHTGLARKNSLSWVSSKMSLLDHRRRKSRTSGGKPDGFRSRRTGPATIYVSTLPQLL